MSIKIRSRYRWIPERMNLKEQHRTMTPAGTQCQLREQGRLRRVGPDKGGRWEVVS